LLERVARAVAKLPDEVSIVRDIASRRTGGYDDRSLSIDRAGSTRGTLIAAGLRADRIATVIGKAATEPMFPDDLRDARNRRISITLLRKPWPATPAEAPPAAVAG
jgi:chemotaxis protein MotB